MVVCAMLVVVFFLCKKAPLILQEAFKEKEDNENSFEMTEKAVVQIEPKQQRSRTVRLGLFLIRSGKFLFLFLQNVEVLYYLLYGVAAIVGTLYHPFFFAFHLSAIVVRYPTMRNIVRSVWEPRVAIVLTLVLLFIVVYVFTLIGFTFLHDDYQGYCEELWSCFLKVFDNTFKSNGGLGGWLDSLNKEDLDKFPGTFNEVRFVYDNIFNWLVVIVIISIIAGLMIDMFGILREQEAERKADIENFCFICGLSKEIFERRSVDHKSGFLKHIKCEHYMWNYVFFIAFILQKKQNDLNGIESYVLDMVKEGDMSWFPYQRALAMKNVEDFEDEQQIRENLEQISRSLGSAGNQLKLVERALDNSREL
eukprot:TRINITY_DN10446_c0_g1_i2.p1 TRINITY_DN10446_c0_g1~~TRINITY_DN10446_c0_g1_i2.p1  ORF type:complete len:365 (-),score=81.01 TRINITY_DN10446_c0_g1_i2:712-1806(-)